MEDNGGMVACVEKGLIHEKLAKQAYEKEKKLRNGEKPWVAVNMYTADGCGEAKAADREEPMELHESDPDALNKQLKRLSKTKKKRNNEKVKQVLGDLERIVREGKENVMPCIIDAVRSYATIGEITGVLQKVYGKFKCPTGI